jgi:hypothetical protein
VISTATLFLVSEGLHIVEQDLRRRVDPHWQRGLSYLKYCVDQWLSSPIQRAGVTQECRIMGHD